MARVSIKELATRYAHFGLYTTSAGGDEPIVVRRKMGETTDYLHRNSRKLRRQRVNLALASQHWSHLTPTQKGYYRNQMDYVEVLGSPSEEKLLKGRQLFISREIRELNVVQKQLTTPFEVCIILVDEAYNPLRGKLWLGYKPTESSDWVWMIGDELIKGNFLFRNVPPGQFVYHPYGESEGYYDPETAWLTQDELRRYHYHILLDRYYRLVLKEPWTVDMSVPPLEQVILEPWTHIVPFPELGLVILEPWTGLPFPELGLVILEPWTGVLPPELEEVITEPWTGGILPPELELVILEPWTGGILPPELEEVIAEDWTGILEQMFANYTVLDTSGDTVLGNRWAAQTFIATSPHQITQVRVNVNKTWGSHQYPMGNFIISIRNTDAAGKPTGADLCIGQTNAEAFVDYPAWAWATITFDVPYTLTQGKLYAIVCRLSTSQGTNWTRLRVGKTTPGYPDGKLAYSWDGGVTWTLYSAYDYNFQEWGLPI